MRRLTLLLPFALAACVAPRPAPPPPPLAAPPPAAPVPAPPVVAWTDGPVAPGTWTWEAAATGSVARFGVAGQDAAFAVRCDPAQRRIVLTVPGDAAATLLIETSDGARGYPATATGGTPPHASAATPASDAFLDRIAFSRGRFRVRLGGGAPVVIPAWPEFARTVEDCRP